MAEAIGLLRDESRRVLVDAERHLTPVALVPVGDARRRQREDPGRDLLGIHEGDSAFRRPWRDWRARGIAAVIGQLLRPERRNDMLMNVDAMRSAHGPFPRSEGVGRDLRPRRDPLPLAELIGVAHGAVTEAISGA